MELFFSPLACSMASRIALYEAGAVATFTQVNTKTKRLEAGGDFLPINPMGQVPVLRTDDGRIVTENPAVLATIAARYPEAGLTPVDPAQRIEVERWLSFVGSEMHLGVFTPLLDPRADEGAKAYARLKAPLRFEVLDQHLSGREYLTDAFSVADAYLFTVLNWSRAVSIDLHSYPAITAFQTRLGERASVRKALGEEVELYKEEQRKQAA